MGILEFFRKKHEKNNISIKQEIEHQNQSEEEKIREEILSKKYNSHYVYAGCCDKTIEVNGKNIKYEHLDFFLDENQGASGSDRVIIRLTGDNLTGQPIHITDNVFECNGQTYTLYKRCMDHVNLYRRRTGDELATIAKNWNQFCIKIAVAQQEKQEKIDEIQK